MKHLFAAVALVCAMAPVQAQSWSGFYMVHTSTAVISMELVQMSTGEIVGRYKSVSLTTDGKVITVEAPVSGAAQGNTFIGKIETAWHESGTLPIIGRRTGRLIDFSESKGFKARLEPGAAEEEKAAIADIHLGAREIAEGRQRDKETRAQIEEVIKNEDIVRNRAKGLLSLIKDSKLYVAEGSKTFTQFQDYPARYAATTTKLRNMSVQWQGVQGSSGEATGKRSQLSSAMLHTAIDETKQPHIKVSQAFEQSISNFKELEESSARAMKVCGQPQPRVAMAQMIAPICSQLQELQPLINAAASDSRERFRKLKAVYTREVSEQRALLSAVQQSNY